MLLFAAVSTMASYWVGFTVGGGVVLTCAAVSTMAGCWVGFTVGGGVGLTCAIGFGVGLAVGS